MTIGFGSYGFEVVFRADGIGVTKEGSWYEFFEHDLNLEEISRDCENDGDAINDFLRDHFNEHISPQDMGVQRRIDAPAKGKRVA